jgi:hypothetical protein
LRNSKFRRDHRQQATTIVLHHYGYCRAVNLLGGDILKKFLSWAARSSGAPNRLNDHLDGPPHLTAQTLSDLLLGVEACRKQLGQGLLFWHADEPAPFK